MWHHFKCFKEKECFIKAVRISAYISLRQFQPRASYGQQGCSLGHHEISYKASMMEGDGHVKDNWKLNLGKLSLYWQGELEHFSWIKRLRDSKKALYVRKRQRNVDEKCNNKMATKEGETDSRLLSYLNFSAPWPSQRFHRPPMVQPANLNNPINLFLFVAKLMRPIF